jgi:hypothetical protein
LGLIVVAPPPQVLIQSFILIFYSLIRHCHSFPPHVRQWRDMHAATILAGDVRLQGLKDDPFIGIWCWPPGSWPIRILIFFHWSNHA